VALEEILVAGEVLDSDEPVTRFVFDNSVYEERRLTVVDAIEKRR
jgi:hypothetical protein